MIDMKTNLKGKESAGEGLNASRTLYRSKKQYLATHTSKLTTINLTCAKHPNTPQVACPECAKEQPSPEPKPVLTDRLLQCLASYARAFYTAGIVAAVNKSVKEHAEIEKLAAKEGEVMFSNLPFHSEAEIREDEKKKVLEEIEKIRDDSMIPILDDVVVDSQRLSNKIYLLLLKQKKKEGKA